MGSCAAPSAKGDDKFITTDYLQQCVQLHQQKGMISLSPPTICNSAFIPELICCAIFAHREPRFRTAEK
uniref:hypothetical protein n=1 Tax=Salmonella enterica TaxID=28901 RepID=UPI00155DB558|nr:hypothetical protein [Salmonella enterica]